jgi:hypothetical protein
MTIGQSAIGLSRENQNFQVRTSPPALTVITRLASPLKNDLGATSVTFSSWASGRRIPDQQGRGRKHKDEALPVVETEGISGCGKRFQFESRLAGAYVQILAANWSIPKGHPG